MGWNGKAAIPGFTLLELMIAIVIFAGGLGAYALLMLKSVHDTEASLRHSLAVTQAQAMAEQLRQTPHANAPSLDSAGSETCLDGSSCMPGAMSGAALRHWQDRLAQLLPNGSGTVCNDSTPDDGSTGADACSGSGELVVKVFWQAPGAGSEPADSRRRFVTVVGLP
ncbi:MAG: prepilin-type N-terminal cleavage/methylation domain-containing protein [Xanthomonadales bacterium]|jgi:type IV pilus assembly protein PilV|nr:prepilin-type N-terminal cleavage/methylation domain-containing protein [Xanthomonadales bacterium]